jgi:outer membrane receptor protein involved in Fe transport
MNPVLRIGYYYQSDSVSEIFNDGIPNVEIPSYSTVDLRISWRELLGSGTEIALFGNNLLDEEYRVFATGYETFKFNAFGYGPPRMWGAEFRKEF